MKMTFKRIALTTAAAMTLTSAALVGTATASNARQKKQIVIGYSTYTVENPAFAGIIGGLRAECKKYGYKLIVENSNNSATLQDSQIESLVSRKVNFILETPANGYTMGPAIQAANAAHIPIFSDVDITDGPVTATYSMSHYQGGLLAGQQIVKYLKHKYGTPVRGSVVDLEGIPGIIASKGREAGFEAAIKPYPGIKVVAQANGGYDTSVANSAMSTILVAHPKIDAVYGANDAETYGAIEAIKAAGLFKPVGSPGHIYAIGVDGSLPGIQGVLNGSQDASVSQNFIRLQFALMSAIHAYVTGKKMPKTNSKCPWPVACPPKPSHAYHGKFKNDIWPLMVITKANIHSPAVKAYGIWALSRFAKVK